MQTQDTNTAVAPTRTYCDLWIFHLTYSRVPICRTSPTVFVSSYMLLIKEYCKTWVLLFISSTEIARWNHICGRAKVMSVTNTAQVVFPLIVCSKSAAYIITRLTRLWTTLFHIQAHYHLKNILNGKIQKIYVTGITESIWLLNRNTWHQ